MLDLRSGGWVLILAIIVPIGVVAWRLSESLPQRRTAIGDGVRIESYGFDLSHTRVPIEQLVPGGVSKDGLPALLDPQTIPASQIQPRQRLGGVQKLVSGDRVVGVEIEGQARAYPLWILAWHEIVNDTLADTPIAVTYSPLCDSVVVFERHVAGETLEFGVSGLLLNCNLVMFDRRPAAAGESLWSQLRGEAIAGPAAGGRATLRVLAAQVMRWADWRELHPDTSVILPQPDRARLYKRDVYLPYFGNDLLRFPVDPLPADDLPRKTNVIAIRRPAGQWQVWPLSAFRAAPRTVEIDGLEVELVYRGGPATVSAFARDAQPLEVVNALWFAWYAHWPETRLRE